MLILTQIWPKSFWYKHSRKWLSPLPPMSRLLIKQRYTVRCLADQLLHHSQHAKNQLNSYTHSADFRVSWTKWLHQFWTRLNQKSVKQILAFLNLHQHAKNQFISSIHSWYSQLQSLMTRLATPISGHAHSQIFWSTFNLCGFALKKWGYFSYFFWRWLIKKSYILIGWEHFDPYLRNQNFPKYGICAGTQQIIQSFIIEQIQQKLMTKCFNTKSGKGWGWGGGGNQKFY